MENVWSEHVRYAGLGAIQRLAFSSSQTKSYIFFFRAPVIFGGVVFQILAGLKLFAVLPDEQLPSIACRFQVFHWHLHFEYRLQVGCLKRTVGVRYLFGSFLAEFQANVVNRTAFRTFVLEGRIYHFEVTKSLYTFSEMSSQKPMFFDILNSDNTL